MKSDEVPAVDIDISDPSDDKGNGPVEGSHKVVVSNSQVAHKPDFVDRTAKKGIYINGSSYKNGKIFEFIFLPPLRIGCSTKEEYKVQNLSPIA